MKIRLIGSYWLMFLLMIASVTFAACSKDVVDDEENGSSVSGKSEDGNVTDVNSTLVVRTRAVADNAQVSFPVYIYVFDLDDICLGTAVIESSESSINMELAEGEYAICAVAGANKDDYDIPTKENATAESVISLRQGKSHGDLMYSLGFVSLGAGEKITHVLSLERKVMLLQEVTISDVPSQMTDVSVTIKPLYEGLRLDGSYSGTDGSYTVHLTRQEGTNVWTKNPNVYLLEAVSGASVKVEVKMTDDKGTGSTYSYLLENELQANYKINIKGTYIAQSGITLSGIIAGVDWEGERTITFDFDENGSTGGSEDESGQVVTGESPAGGTLYKGCYVLSAELLANKTTTVTLISPTQTFGLVFTEDDPESVKAAVNEGIKTVAVDGIEGWRLPSYSEISLMLDKYNEINKAFEAATGKTSNIVPALSYFYKTSEGDIWAYTQDKELVFSSVTRLRAFATLTFK